MDGHNCCEDKSSKPLTDFDDKYDFSEEKKTHRETTYYHTVLKTKCQSVTVNTETIGQECELL